MANSQGLAPQYRDVIHEDAIKIGPHVKAPDNAFTLHGQRMPADGSIRGRLAEGQTVEQATTGTEELGASVGVRGERRVAREARLRTGEAGRPTVIAPPNEAPRPAGQ